MASDNAIGFAYDPEGVAIEQLGPAVSQLAKNASVIDVIKETVQTGSVESRNSHSSAFERRRIYESGARKR
jgi:hypothetical protein